STDIWTGTSRKMFISLTIHFADGDLLRSLDLACEPFNVAHTGVNIAQKLKTILVDKGLDPKKCTGVTIDNASNMIKAAEILGADDDNNIVTVSCFCHSLQLTIHRFQGCHYSSCVVPPRLFVRHFQSTQLLKESAEWLGVKFYELQKCVATRWWSDVTSIRSLLRNKRAI
ncbi:unnamed protein product, partial [Laminaria digitata]